MKSRCFIASLLASLLGVVAPVRAATPDEVDQAIRKGKEYLLQVLQANGGENWEIVQKREGVGGHSDVKSAQWGGLTSIATYALLASGESPQLPALKKPLAYLKSTDICGMYALGLRSQVWPFLPPSEGLEGAKRDGDLILASLKTGGAAGKFHYYANITRSTQFSPAEIEGIQKPFKVESWDHSVSQYGVLGMWACVQAGYEAPRAFWEEVDKSWRAKQSDDGGFDYAGKGGGTPSMTAAGVATLFITADYLYRDAGLNCTGNVHDKNIKQGLDWFTRLYTKERGFNPYTLYGVERIGVASGYKYFGTADWYKLGADQIVREAQKKGWGRPGKPEGKGEDISNAAFRLLFLCRGRAPVVMNKLAYDIAGKEGNWNQRPRDAANFAKWASKSLERDLNWQIVNLKVDVEELHDAPLLYLPGNQELALSEGDEMKLKQFIEGGGIVVGHPDGGSAVFEASFQKLGQKLFPKYTFKDVPKDHLLYTTPSRRSTWKDADTLQPKILTNGARVLMVSLGKSDPARYWQTRSVGGRDAQWQFMRNLFVYSVDKEGLRYKDESYTVVPDKKKSPVQTIKVGRFVHSGNWDPEPGGWRRLAAVFNNEYGTKLEVLEVGKGGEKIPADVPLVHLTSTEKLALTGPELECLKAYVEQGGTLLLDSCGGDAMFSPTAEQELKKVFGATFSLNELSKHAIYDGPTGKVKNVQYRRFSRKIVGSRKTPHLMAWEPKAGKLGVIMSPEDLSVGLVGQQVDGIVGYEPDWATRLVSNIVLTVAGKQPQVPTVAKPKTGAHN